MIGFSIDGGRYEYLGPRSVIDALRSIQFQVYEHDEFMDILKNRLRKWTGKDEVMFYSEEQVVDLLAEIGTIKFNGGMKK